MRMSVSSLQILLLSKSVRRSLTAGSVAKSAPSFVNFQQYQKRELSRLTSPSYPNL